MPQDERAESHQERELAVEREINEALLAFARMLDSLSPWPGFFRWPSRRIDHFNWPSLGGDR
jgi:hypothetical protein